MSAPGRRRREHHEEHPDERWLLTYSDMITLLMALFIVLWAISSVNVSKFEELSASLKSAFSGKVLPQNTSILSGQSAPFDQAGKPIRPTRGPPSRWTRSRATSRPRRSSRISRT
jgi:flagellar motor protein MotB